MPCVQGLAPRPELAFRVKNLGKRQLEAAKRHGVTYTPYVMRLSTWPQITYSIPFQTILAIS